jgi:hypothetical protein|tara:strand:- start:2715 stop:2966 length:252 start_codon:yes stop_codon:yes gene_type:complete
MFECNFCRRSFTASRSKTQHEKDKHPDELAELHKCKDCNDEFDRAEDLARHRKDKHQAFFSCTVCGIKHMTVADIQAHNMAEH